MPELSPDGPGAPKAQGKCHEVYKQQKPDDLQSDLLHDGSLTGYALERPTWAWQRFRCACVPLRVQGFVTIELAVVAAHEVGRAKAQGSRKVTAARTQTVWRSILHGSQPCISRTATSYRQTVRHAARSSAQKLRLESVLLQAQQHKSHQCDRSHICTCNSGSNHGGRVLASVVRGIAHQSTTGTASTTRSASGMMRQQGKCSTRHPSHTG